MAEQLFLTMDCPTYKAYLVFLKDNLDTVCRINMAFQSENANPFLLFEDIFVVQMYVEKNCYICTIRVNY